MYATPIGTAVRLAGIVGVGIFPLLHEFGFLNRRRWLIGWVIVFTAREVWQFYLTDLTNERVNRRVAKINKEIAGNINSLARRTASTGKKPAKLTEDQSHELVASLLSRVRDYVLYQTGKSEETPLRVTIAVPQCRLGSTRPAYLQVWCYDRHYDDRNWTELELATPGEPSIRGAPQAFVTGLYDLVGDIRTVRGVNGVERRAYRTVLSVPVRSATSSGQPCAIVNIDVAEPHFFKKAAVEDQILPLIAPILSIIGMTLSLRLQGETYAFGN